VTSPKPAGFRKLARQHPNLINARRRIGAYKLPVLLCSALHARPTLRGQIDIGAGMLTTDGTSCHLTGSTCS
jgi:hypothetical protein